MESNIKKLWQVICEIEGLTLLADNKVNNLPHDLISLIKEKISILHTIIDEIENTESGTLLDQCTISNNETIIGEYHQNAKTITTDTGNTFEEIDNILDSEIDLNDNNSIGDEFIDATETIETVNDDIDIIDLDTEIVLETSGDIEPDIEISEPITIEEKIIRQNSRDLKLAFTINDRYRFRRELFGNSDTEFIDMINLVSAMASLSEAEEYFYGDLEWDQENEEVRDFMNIITHYFSN